MNTKLEANSRPRLWLSHGQLPLRFADGTTARRALAEGDKASLQDFSARYASACVMNRIPDLKQLGQAIGAWLDDPGSWVQRLVDDVAESPLFLEVAATLDPSPEEVALLEAPWELAAAPGHADFLIGERAAWAPMRCLVPVRCLPGSLEPSAAPESALGVLFMAAAPINSIGKPPPPAV